MKTIFFTLLLSFQLSSEFKNWSGDFEFTHFEFGKFKMKREFTSSENNIVSKFRIRPLLIFEYSQKSNLRIDGKLVSSVSTEVTNNVPGDHPKFFKVSFVQDKIESDELGFDLDVKDKVYDQLGSDLQMRLNIKNGIYNFDLNVIDNTKGDIVRRSYGYVGDKLLNTPFGTFKTKIITAQARDTGKITYLIAPELDYIVIKSFVELKNGNTNTLELVKAPKFSEE
jgi:hypothetical protein